MQKRKYGPGGRTAGPGEGDWPRTNKICLRKRKEGLDPEKGATDGE